MKINKKIAIVPLFILLLFTPLICGLLGLPLSNRITALLMLVGGFGLAFVVVLPLNVFAERK